jgi:hypothetical protein
MQYTQEKTILKLEDKKEESITHQEDQLFFAYKILLDSQLNRKKSIFAYYKKLQVKINLYLKISQKLKNKLDFDFKRLCNAPTNYLIQDNYKFKQSQIPDQPYYTTSDIFHKHKTAIINYQKSIAIFHKFKSYIINDLISNIDDILDMHNLRTREIITGCKNRSECKERLMDYLNKLTINKYISYNDMQYLLYLHLKLLNIYQFNNLRILSLEDIIDKSN